MSSLAGRSSYPTTTTRPAAVEVEGVKLDDSAKVAGKDLKLNGAGVRVRAIFKVYVMGLYLGKKETSTDAVLASAEGLAERWGQGGLVVVATQGRLDVQGLEAALSVQPAHCWFVASERKARVLKNQLVESGQDAARVAAIIAPAGERIGAQTAEEIALAVLASVVAARRGRVAVSAAATDTVEV